MDTLSALRAGKLAGTRRLDLPNFELDEFPEEIFELADTLEILNLSGNALSRLPDTLPHLHRLRVIFCSDNRFRNVPEILGQCNSLEMVGFKANRIDTLPASSLPPQLRWLILTDNNLAQLPAALGNCSRLQKLMLAGNRLSSLPDELAGCTRLELLRIAANRFTRLPGWLFSLPRLAWLAYAGNPCSDDAEQAALQRHPIRLVEWNSLQVQDKLGEGASGVIYRALQPAAQQAVAVKLFKGTLTSDGLPHSEKAAWIAAGAHPHLIPVTGKISAHPEDASGLVMPLIDHRFRNLADPPSLDSCTRDIYHGTAAFTLVDAFRIALGIAAAAEHLHRQGIMHGDLYAHNILWDGGSGCLLGDFGAASFVSSAPAAALQRLEVRAFACLLEELLQRCEFSADTRHLADALWELQHRCDQPAVAERPLFDEIRHTLAALRDTAPVTASANP